MSEEESPLVPEWKALGIPEDDTAEAEDVDVAHETSVDDVDALQEEDDN